MRGVGVFFVAKDGIGYAPECLLQVGCPKDGIGVRAERRSGVVAGVENR